MEFHLPARMARWKGTDAIMGIIVNLKFIRGIASDMGRLLFEKNEDIICLIKILIVIFVSTIFFFFFACNCCTNYVFISFLLTIRQYFFILDFIFTWRFIRDCYTWDFIERFIFIDKYLRYYIFFQVTFELFWNQLKCIEHKGKTLKNR